MAEGSMEIRTFGSLDEIRALPSFVPDNPIDKNNYDKLVGDYHFGKMEALCCFRKPNGNLCGKEHGNGYVAVLKDQTITIIGGDCAQNQFDAEDALRRDAALYMNEKRRRDNLNRLADLVRTKDQTLSELQHWRDQLKALEKTVDGWRNSLGQPTCSRLLDMARTGNSAIMVKAVTIKKFRNERDEPDEERTFAPARIGGIGGAELFTGHSIRAVYEAMSAVARAYAQAEQPVEKIRASELEQLTAQLADTERIAQEAQRLLALEEQFLKSDIALLCFIHNDRGTRYGVARAALALTGKQLSKDGAKEWVGRTERELASRLGASAIEVY